MKNKIYKKDGKLVIEIPLVVDRFNPYSESVVGKMENVVGVVTSEEIGFSYFIDRDYKGKSDDVSSIFYHFDGDRKEFEALCHKLGITWVVYPTCAYCGHPVLGSSTFGDKGTMCFTCELSGKK